MTIAQRVLRIPAAVFMCIGIPIGFIAFGVVAGFAAGWGYGEEILNLGAAGLHGWRS